jgi:hypothetical protein
LVCSDILEEGKRLTRAAAEAGLTLRLLGGVAVCLRSNELPPALQRSYGDLDFVAGRRSSAEAQNFFREAGYEPQVAFNALNSKERLLFFDNENQRQVDIFIGQFRMSHSIPLDDRLEIDETTVPLAELLMMKLQVHELNEKDIRDAVAVLYGHELDDRDGDTVNVGRIAQVCCSDWGLCRTLTANLEHCRAHVGEYELEPDDRERIGARFEEVRTRIDDEPKTRSWRLRAKIGDRKRWYELPEEVGGGP